MAINSNPTNNPTIKWGAIFIIALMLLSGVAVFIGSQNPSTPTNTSNQTPENVEQYSAEDVSGTIAEVFNTAIVGGKTSDGDKTVIDSRIKTIPGVESISSQFSPLSSDGSVTYIANLTLSSSTDHAQFADAVTQLELFDSPEVYFQASAQVEKEHEVLNAKGQLTRITLPNVQIQAIVSPLTIKGDSITGSLAAAFDGTKLVSAYLLEMQNLTASPTPISLSHEYPIQTLHASLSITGTLDYYPGLSSDSISSGINSLPSVSGVAVPFFPAVNTTLFVDYPDANTISSDLNAFVQNNPQSFDSFSLFPNGFSVGLTNTRVNAAKELLSTKVNELTSSNAALSFTPPRTQFLLDVNTTTPSTTLLASAIENYFNALDANADVQVYQNGIVSAQTLSPFDSNVSYAVPNNEISVALTPGHSVGDLVNVLINAIALRGELVYVNGVESRDENLTFI